MSDSYGPQLLDQLQQLVACQTVSSTVATLDCGNLSVIELLANWLNDSGFDCHIQNLTSKHQTDGASSKKANLIATLGANRAEEGGGIVLAGHTDTVPFNEALWQQNPLQLMAKEGRLYGLGATDMKGFFPIALAALQPFIDNPKQLIKPITIVATADEESTMGGARQLHQALLPNPEFAIIGEPTNMQPIRMHKGFTSEAIRVQGRSGHSSNPQLGLNAMEVMHQIIGELLKWREQLQQRHINPMFDIAVPTLNLGCIHGGDNPNRICGDCYMEFDIRPLPGMRLSDLRQQVAQIVQVVAERFETTITMSHISDGVEPFEQASDSRLVELSEQYSGQVSSSVAFATEAPFFKQLGMQTLIMGPGSIDQAHSPNEYMDSQQIPLAIERYQQIIRQLCL